MKLKVLTHMITFPSIGPNPAHTIISSSLYPPTLLINSDGVVGPTCILTLSLKVGYRLKCAFNLESLSPQDVT